MANKKFVIDGREIVFLPLTVEDMTLIRGRIKEKKKAERKEIQERQMATAEKLGGIEPLQLLEYLDKPVREGEIDEGMDSFESLAYAAYLGARKKHSDITEQSIKQFLTPDDLIAVSEIISPTEEPPSISVDMKVLEYRVNLANGKTATINELIVESRKKKRTRNPIKKK